MFQEAICDISGFGGAGGAQTNQHSSNIHSQVIDEEDDNSLGTPVQGIESMSH